MFRCWQYPCGTPGKCHGKMTGFKPASQLPFDVGTIGLLKA